MFCTSTAQNRFPTISKLFKQFSPSFKMHITTSMTRGFNELESYNPMFNQDGIATLPKAIR